MTERDAKQVPELQGGRAAVAIALVIAALVGGGAWGFHYAGPLGGLLGVLLGAAVGTLAFTILRATAGVKAIDERAAADVGELPPDQAIQVLSAMMSATSQTQMKLELSGGLLAQISEAEDQAGDGDLAGALERLRDLCDENPRSPAVPRAIAGVLAGHDGEDHRRERDEAVVRTFTLALRGGMNRMAGEFWAELDAPARERLELDAQQWAQLAKVLAARGDEAGAEACRGRAGADA